MANANQLVDLAETQVGYNVKTDREDGSKYGRWYAYQTGEDYYSWNGVPYCAMFVSWCLGQLGLKAVGFPNASCSNAVAKAKSQHKMLHKSELRRGDIVMYDWDGDGIADHTGIVTSANFSGGILKTIEGNTSVNYGGLQTNGGMVARKTRGYGYVIGGIRPDFNDGKLSENGVWDTATTLKLQSLLKSAIIDGTVSGQTEWTLDKNPGLSRESWRYGTGGSLVIRKLQIVLRSAGKYDDKIDGLFGPKTIKALQSYMGTEVDGYISNPSMCVREMQRRLLKDIL